MRALVTLATFGIGLAFAVSGQASQLHSTTDVLHMTCKKYDIFFIEGKGTFWTEASGKETKFPVWKIEEQDNQTVVTGRTRHGDVTAYFGSGDLATVVWADNKNVVLDRCLLAKND